MRIAIREKAARLLAIVSLSRMSLAGKCRVLFGSAVVLIIALALLIPYAWMTRLKSNVALDMGRGSVLLFYRNHFAPDADTGRVPLDETGAERTQPGQAVFWIDLRKEREPADQKLLLSPRQDEAISTLRQNHDMTELAWLDSEGGVTYGNYIRIVRAADDCLRCHNPQGTASPFNRNEAVGAIVMRTAAREIEKVALMNLIWVVVAGLLAGAGAIVVFYVIVQRVILSPIRQLRAIANNVADGNLDVRAGIATADEYEKLSSAFNHMLDSLQESQQQLRKANKELDTKIAELSDRNTDLFKANKLKSEFLANISHEFRTPLNAILGFAEILRDKPAADIDKNRRYAENIITSGRSLLTMINDLLDLAKAESGRIDLHLAPASITELCENMMIFFTPLAQKKLLSLHLHCDKDIPITKTDPGKVQQILYNYLSNAIKFTPEQGRIEIRATLTDDEKTIRIAVSDTGPGIAPEDHEKIFEKFRQIDGSITRQTTGTGLGLAISKELAKLINGTVGVKSQPAHGATFTLDIPVVPIEEESNGKADAAG
ncbi:MAG TPA: ATP-binding protein [Sedimentisphaerales bacterium]|nr:ATP-binding protein [Sedimentisphaerales bacterium]